MLYSGRLHCGKCIRQGLERRDEGVEISGSAVTILFICFKTAYNQSSSIRGVHC